MPSLGKYDPLAKQEATTEDVNRYREYADSLVTVGQAQFQFDYLSKHRWQSVLAGMEEGDYVAWGSTVGSITLDKSGLEDLYRQVEVKFGSNTLANYTVAQELKSQIAAGKLITVADVRDAAWVS